MHFYNDNQIARMKAQKHQLKLKGQSTFYPEQYIEKVLYPFYPQINSRKISVFIARKSMYNFEIKADWKRYQLVIFNIIQNAVKYNKCNGSIVILTQCQKEEETPEVPPCHVL